MVRLQAIGKSLAHRRGKELQILNPLRTVRGN